MKIQDRIFLKTNEEDLPMLTAVADAVDVSKYKDLKDIKSQMFNIMRESKGIGLAAPQVGLSVRMFVMTTKNGEDLLMVNPVFKKKSSFIKKSKEGCLSVPDKQVTVNRSMQVVVDYYDENLEWKSIRLNGIDAYCAQHEMDHLNGVIL